MTHPLLRVVCLYAAGILLGFFGELRWEWVIVPLLAVATASAFHARLRPLLWMALLICGGWLNFTLHTRVWSSDDLRRVVAEEPVLADVRGHLVETPRITIQTRGDEVLPRTLAELSLTQLRTNNAPWIPATGRIAVSSSGTLGEAFFQGQRVEVSGVLAKPPGPRAAGLFDYATYLQRRGVHFMLRAGGPEDWMPASDAASTPPFTDRFVEWARRTLSRGLPENDPATDLLPAMTLGWKTALTDEIERPFMRSGTMHIFAISGLHIALIAGIVLAVLRLLRVPRGLCGTLLIPLLWFYTAATGWQPSAVRATVMMTIILGGWSLRRPSNLLNSLAAAAMIILLFDPRQLFQASFQLSFAVVLTLSLVLPPLQERALHALRPDPLLPAELVPLWKRWLGTPIRWLLLLGATSLAAWLGSVLLTAQYFHLFSPVALLANVILVPCASAALASALASLATGAWWPWLSEVFNNSAWFWMSFMMNTSRNVSELPGAWRYVAAPSPALLAVYYGTLLTLAFGGIKQAGLKWFLAGSGVVMAGLLMWQIHLYRSSAGITVLPLNGGLAVHVKMPGRSNTILVDCGNTNAFESVLLPFLHARGENTIRALLLSHGDVRHMGAATLALDECQPSQVGISPVRFRSGAYRQLVDEILPERGEVTELKRGDSVEDWTVLHPSAGLRVNKADEGALVLRGSIHGFDILLLSDLNRAGQRRLLDECEPELLRADVVISGLPDDDEPLINDLLRAIQPGLIIVGDDEWPSKRRASNDLLERLRGSGATVLSTRKTSAATIEFDRHRWRVMSPTGDTLAEFQPETPLETSPP